MENETSQFLGTESDWYESVITLETGQLLQRATRLKVTGSGQVFVTVIESARRPQQYWFFLKQVDIQALRQLLLAQNLLTLSSEEQPDIADAIPATITLTNAANQTQSLFRANGQSLYRAGLGQAELLPATPDGGYGHGLLPARSTPLVRIRGSSICDQPGSVSHHRFIDADRLDRRIRHRHLWAATRFGAGA